MGRGFWGKLLRVDLTGGKIWEQEISEATYRLYPGGKALAVYLLLQNLSRATDPLGPQNVLVLAQGLLTGAPHEITPETGDKFTILERWMDVNAQGGATKIATEEGKTLTFGADNFTWKELYAAAGDYVIGFIVEDLDGNSYPSYAAVQVQ